MKMDCGLMKEKLNPSGTTLILMYKQKGNRSPSAKHHLSSERWCREAHDLGLRFCITS